MNPFGIGVAAAWLAAALMGTACAWAQSLTPAHILLKGGGTSHYTIDGTGVSLFASAANKQANKPEFKLYPEEYQAFARLIDALPPDSLARLYKRKGKLPLQTLRVMGQPIPPDGSLQDPRRATASMAQGQGPLAGVRIALDPGHIADDWDEAYKLESRAMIMRPGDSPSETLKFHEANLAFATATLLRQAFEAQGATVMLTRPAAGRSASGQTFEEWEAAMPASLKAKKLSDGTLYRDHFTKQDLGIRASKINDFNPDITLIIHFNVHLNHGKEYRADGTYIPMADNYNMAFVSGAAPGLGSQEERLRFLRWLVGDDVRNSIRLSELVLQKFTEHLGVPTVSEAQARELFYLRDNSIATDAPGVYTRNLALTRSVRGTLCYGESLCQNHGDEARSLAQEDIEVAGIRAPARVQEVADAYFAAVMAYVQECRAQNKRL